MILQPHALMQQALRAGVDMRLEASTMMVEGWEKRDAELWRKGRDLADYSEKVRRQYRPKV